MSPIGTMYCFDCHIEILNLEQALGATGGLVLAASRLVSSKEECRTAPVLWKFCNLLSLLVGTGYISAQTIQTLRSFLGGVYIGHQQQDAHEFLLALVDKCKSDRNETSEDGQ
jgi:hypothetical protein